MVDSTIFGEGELIFKEILEKVQLVAVMLDCQGRLVFCNDYFLKLIGYAKDEVIGRDWFDTVIPQANRLELRTSFFETLGATNQSVYHHECIVTKDGRVRIIALNTIICKDQAGSPIGITCIGEDVTEREQAQKALRESEAGYRDLFENANDLIQSCDRDGRLLYVNKAWHETLGYDKVELAQLTLRQIIAPECWDQCSLLFQRVLLGEDVGNVEVTFLSKDGKRIIVEGKINCKCNDGLPIATRGIFRDITDRKRAEREMWQERERALVTLQGIGDAVITTDSEGKIEYFNPAAEQLVGSHNSAVQGLLLKDVVQIIKTSSQVVNPITECLQKGESITYSDNLLLLHKDGSKFAIEQTVSPIKNLHGEIIGVVLVIRDVTEKRNMVNHLKHQAFHDALTGLPNRAFLSQRLRNAMADAEKDNVKLAVLFVDLDRFKNVNDLLGHAIGDDLLRQVSAKLKTCVKTNDLVARLGGDEFIVLIKVNHQDEAKQIAERIVEVFKGSWAVGGYEFHITVSIGISIFPNDGSDVETLMRHADIAMYRAKEQGKNSYHFYTLGLNTQVFEKMAAENSLHMALDRQEFIVHYQPLIHTVSGVITGVEALIRWVHPEKGLVLPDEFVPLAEETGLVVPIGEWILKTACYQNKAWQRDGFSPIKVTVNLSAYQFRQQNLVDTVKSILAETQLEPEWLQLEITESAAMQDVEFSIKLLEELADMGISLSIDDFGTGYSSLNYLKRLPIDSLKIDRTFISDITADSDGAAIVTTIIGLANNLKLNVIAEGVETEQQMNFLKAKNCHEMQGFLISEPVEPIKIEAYLKRATLLQI